MNRRQFLAAAAGAAVAQALPAAPHDLTGWTVEIEPAEPIDLTWMPKFEVVGFVELEGFPAWEIRNACYRPILMRMPDALPPLRRWYWSSLVLMPDALVVIPTFCRESVLGDAECIEDAHVCQLYSDGVPVRTSWSSFGRNTWSAR